MRTRRRQQARRVWRQVHLGLALVAGFLFAFLGLTGSLLVFHKEIDSLLNPDLLARQSKGGEVAIPAVVARVAERIGPVLRVDAPGDDEGNYRVQARRREMAGALAEVFVDPGSGVILGTRPWRENPVAVLYDLHYTLLLGRRGQDIVGFAGLALLASVGSGLYLWWPGRRRLRQALRIKRRAPASRRLYDIHKAVALPAALLLCITAVSGATMAFPDAARTIVQSVLPTATPEPPAGPTNAAPGGDPGLAQAIARAQEMVPGARVRRILLSAEGGPLWRIYLRGSDDCPASAASSTVTIDATVGRVVRFRTIREYRPADWFLALQLPLHNGQALGLTGRVVVFLLGLVPATLYVSGLLLWRARHRARRQRS